MSNTETSKVTQESVSVLDRIEALRRHVDLFEHIATQPQSGVYDRFGNLWPKVVAVLEGEVHHRNALFDAFVSTDSYAMDVNSAQVELWKVAKSLLDAMTYHSTAVSAWRTSALAPSVAEGSMDNYRIHSAFKCGNELAANGQPSFLYGTKDTDAYATICDDEFDRLERFVTKWVLQPFLDCLDFVSKPFRAKNTQELPSVSEESQNRSAIFQEVSTNAIAAWARSFMVTVAILCASAAIFTLNKVKKRQMRIVVMALFALVYALLIQFLSPRSLPMYTLILSFFQSMVMFVGTADDDSE